MQRQLLTIFSTIFGFFLILFIFSKFLGPIPFQVNNINTNKSDAFYVNGEGRVAVKPDMVVVKVGVTSTGPNVKAVQDQINEKINKVSEAIKGLGVSADDIQTENFNVNPNYDFVTGSQKIVSYSATTNLSIKVREVDKANSIIDAATANGANQIGGITFDISDKTKFQNEAREKAVADAKQKAKQAEKIAGFKLGRIINYSESFGDPNQPYGGVSAQLKEDVENTRIEPGTSDIIVTVTLSYEIL